MTASPAVEIPGPSGKRRKFPAGWEMLAAFLLALCSSFVNDKICLVVTGGLLSLLILRHEDSPADVVGMVFAFACSAPLFRRINDLFHGYHPGSVILIAPYLPYPLLAMRQFTALRSLRKLQYVPILISMLGVSWAYAIGLNAWGVVPATMQLLQYAAGPIVFWYLVRNEEEFDMRKFRTWLVVLGGLEAAYGLFQWAVMPQWDKFWFDATGMSVAGGTPIPFQFRAFGTLNSVAHYAYFHFFLIVVAMGARGYLLSAPLMVAALATTQGRSTWGATAIAFVLVLLLARLRDKVRVFASIAAMSCLVVLLALPFMDKLEVMARRLQTVQNIKGDNSFRDRSNLLDAFIRGGALDDPVGVGLGGSGAAARASGSGMAGIDNGFLQVIWQFGWIGGGLLLSAVALGLLRGLLGSKSLPQVQFLSAAFALFATNVFSSSFEDFVGVMLWIALAVVSMKDDAALLGRKRDGMPAASHFDRKVQTNAT